MDGFILRTVQGLRNKLGHEKIFPLMTNLRGTMFLIAPDQDLSAAGATIYVRNHSWDWVSPGHKHTGSGGTGGRPGWGRVTWKHIMRDK